MPLNHESHPKIKALMDLPDGDSAVSSSKMLFALVCLLFLPLFGKL